MASLFLWYFFIIDFQSSLEAIQFKNKSAKFPIVIEDNLFEKLLNYILILCAALIALKRK